MGRARVSGKERERANMESASVSVEERLRKYTWKQFLAGKARSGRSGRVPEKRDAIRIGVPDRDIRIRLLCRGARIKKSQSESMNDCMNVAGLRTHHHNALALV